MSEKILCAYVANLKEYNAGIMNGEWVDFTESESDIIEKINVITNNGNDEYIICDYESLVFNNIDEYANIDTLIEMTAEYRDIFDKYGEYAAAIIETAEYYASGYESIIDVINKHDFRIYSDCYSMADVAREIINECGYLDNAPDFLARYFDYESYGRDLDIDGYFYYTSGGVYVEMY